MPARLDHISFAER